MREKLIKIYTMETKYKNIKPIKLVTALEKLIKGVVL